MSERLQQAVWFIWLASIPPFIYFSIEQTHDLWMDYWMPVLSLTLLIVIGSLFPIKIKNTSIMPLHGVSLALFLHFGLLIEALVAQIALFTMLTRLKIPRKELYRFPVNSLIILISSIGAAGIFYAAGGSTGNVTIASLQAQMIPVALYVVTHFLLNHGLIYFVRYTLLGMRNLKLIDEAVRWGAVTAALIVPVGLTLALLYQEAGQMAVILIGIPIISISLILKVYNESQKTNHLLKQVSEFGHDANDSLKVDDIIDLFIRNCSKIYPADGLYLYEINAGNKLDPVNSSRSSEEPDIIRSEADGISQHVFRTGESVCCDTRREWKKIDKAAFNPSVQSVLSAPAIRNHEVVAVMTLISEKKNAFEKSHQMVLEIMSNYLTVAVQNAKHLEKTKQESERCALTGLFNFRYFENLLDEKYSNPGPQDEYAIVLLDLDHFKSVNDTYGHQSGNEILAQVAGVLADTVGERGITARYGGEEFVVLLEDSSLFNASKVGENLREAIALHAFTVSDDLESREEKTVHLTASIGVAVKSDEDETPISVLRNADRAMYTGAKQKGRNKVAQYL